MKVLITGGAGYVGTELTKTLVKCGDVEDILIYDNLGRQIGCGHGDNQPNGQHACELH